MASENVLKISFHIGFEGKTGKDEVDEVKHDFIASLKESFASILQEYDITSFRIIDEGMDEGDA